MQLRYSDGNRRLESVRFARLEKRVALVTICRARNVYFTMHDAASKYMHRMVQWSEQAYEDADSCR